MQRYSYPASDLDDVGRLLSALGSFWSRIYSAKDQLATYGYGSAQIAAQAQLNLLETIAALSRYDVPVYHTENWYPLVIKKSELNATPANYYRFTLDNIVFNNLAPVNFDARLSRDFFAFNAAADLTGAGQIYDRLLFPSVALTAGVDFVFDNKNNAILFAVDPFSLETVNRKPIYKGDALVDEEITLWLFKAKFDYQYVFKQFAYAINVRGRSSQNYKNLINAIVNGLLDGGASERAIDDALSAILDVPLAAGTETVEVITTDSRGLIIATDKTVYRFPAAARPTVAVGDVVHRGEQLTDAFVIVELTRAKLPDELTALALDQGFTFGCFYGDLIFENKEVPLVVDSEHPSGYTYVSFELGGFPYDVKQFFDEVHARGIEAAVAASNDPCVEDRRRLGTLAQLLDRRRQPDSEPVAANLPKTINPLQFLIENILRNNAAVVLIKVAEMGPDNLGLHSIRHIRQLIPPHSALFFVYGISGIADSLSAIDDVSEWPQIFKAVAPIADSIAENYITDKGATIRVVGGNCYAAEENDSCHKTQIAQSSTSVNSSSSSAVSSSSLISSSSSVISSSAVSSSSEVSSSGEVSSSSLISSSSEVSSSGEVSSSSLISSSSAVSSSSLISSSSAVSSAVSDSSYSSSQSAAALYACVIPKFKYACVIPKFKYACVVPAENNTANLHTQR